MISITLHLAKAFIVLYFIFLFTTSTRETGPIWSKCLPIWLLAIASYLSSRQSSLSAKQCESNLPLKERHLLNAKYQLSICFGLLFSSVGDALLEVVTEDPLFFLGGLAFFLIAHICYIVAFWKTPITIGLHVPVAILTFLIGFLALVLTEVKDKGMIAPIIAYGCVISTMVFMAANRVVSKSASNAYLSRVLAVIGAVIFLSSDCIIAINKFVVVVPHGKLAVMITYYIGQYLITSSATSAHDPSSDRKVH